MKKSNKELMSSAREVLKGNWKTAIKALVVYFLISILLRSIPLFGPLASIIVAGPFSLGMAVFWLAYSRIQNPKLELMFEGFNTWWRAIKAYLLIFVYTALWSLLLLIPGVIAMFSYSMTYYILAEDKNIGIDDAIEKSKKMMEGNKWKLFCLELRFLGWLLLCIPTLGIGLLWLVPYVSVTTAKFYDDIKGVQPETSPVSA